MVIPILIILILLYLTKCFPFKKSESKSSEGFDNVDQKYDNALNSVVNEGDCDNMKREKYNGKVNPISAHDQVNNCVSNKTCNDASINADFTSDGRQLHNNLTYFDSADLLPNKDRKVEDEGWDSKFGANWDESNPQIAKVEGDAWLNERNFLGVYSVASSLRNATHDLRRDVPNPQMVVSPWNNSTIMPDTNNKGLNTL